MDKNCTSPGISSEDKAFVDKFNENYVPDEMIVTRVKSPTNRSKKVNVDGIVTTMDEDALNRMVEIVHGINMGR